MLQVSYSLTCPFTEPGGTDRLNNSLLSATVKLQEDQQQDVASCWLWNHHHHHHTTNNIQIAPQPAQSTLLLQHVTTTVHCYWWSVVLWGKPQYRQLQGCVLYRCPAQQTGWSTYMYTNMTWQEHQRNFTAAKKVKVLVQILVQNCQVKTGQWYFWAVSGQHNFNFNVHAFYYMFGCMCIILCFGMIIIIRYINMNYTHASIYRLYNFQQDSLVFTKLILFFFKLHQPQLLPKGSICDILSMHACTYVFRKWNVNTENIKTHATMSTAYTKKVQHNKENIQQSIQYFLCTVKKKKQWRKLL